MSPQQLEQLKAERDRVKREIAQLQGRLEGLDFSLRLVTGDDAAPTAIAESVGSQRHSRGTVKTTVLGLIEDYKTDGLTASEVVELAEKRGVSLDRGSVSSLLSKLKADGTLILRNGNKYAPTPQRAYVVSHVAA